MPPPFTHPLTHVRFFRGALLLPAFLTFLLWLVSLTGHPIFSAVVSFILLYCGIPYAVFAAFAWKRMNSMTPRRILRFVTLAPWLLALLELMFLGALCPFGETGLGRLFASPQPIECWRIPLLVVVPLGYGYVFGTMILWSVAKASGFVKDEGEDIRLMNRYVVGLFAVGGAVIVSFISSFSARDLIGIMVLSNLELEIIEARMKVPTIYQAAADRLILYCQSDPNLMPDRMGSAWLPKEIQDLGAHTIVVRSGIGFIEFGGGFYHFGYRLSPGKPLENQPGQLLVSTNSLPDFATKANSLAGPVTNTWRLYMMREGLEDLLLTTRRVPSSYKLTTAEILTLAGKGYDRLQATDLKDDRARVGKILYFFDTENWKRPGGRARSGSILSRITGCRNLSMRTFGHGRPIWMRRRPSSPRGLMDTRAFTTTPIYSCSICGKAEAMRRWTPCVRCLNSRSPVTSLPVKEPISSISPIMVPCLPSRKGTIHCASPRVKRSSRTPRRGEEYTRRYILKLEAATYVILGTPEKALDDIKRMPKDNETPWESDDDKRTNQNYLNAINGKDVNFLKDYRNWKSPVADWYTPLQIGENNNRDPKGILSLYPADWRDKVGF